MTDAAQDQATAKAGKTVTLAVTGPQGCTAFRVPNDDASDHFEVTAEGTEVPRDAVKDLQELAANSGVTLAEKE